MDTQDTLYSDIYQHFLTKIEDHKLHSLEDEDLEEILEKYLIASIPKFKYCNKDLSNRDSVLKKFNFELTLEEQEIISLIMIVQWLSPQIYSQELLKEKFKTREFNFFSSSQLLKEMQTLKLNSLKELNEMMTLYYYTN